MKNTALLKNIEAMERLANVYEKCQALYMKCDEKALNTMLGGTAARSLNMLETITERTHNAVMQEFEL